MPDWPDPSSDPIGDLTYWAKVIKDATPTVERTCIVRLHRITHDRLTKAGIDVEKEFNDRAQRMGFKDAKVEIIQ